jgi:exocyst complex component 1
MKTLLTAHLNLIKKPPEDEFDQGMRLRSVPLSSLSQRMGNVGFSPVSTPLGAVGMRRAGTLIKSPMESRQRDREKQSNGNLRASEVHLILTSSSSLTDS